jgi:hypothetical protein
MANLYSNENFPRRVAEELRLLGHDVLSSFEAGRANQQVPDEQVLAFATEQRRAVLTFTASISSASTGKPKLRTLESLSAPAMTPIRPPSPAGFTPRSPPPEIPPGN